MRKIRDFFDFEIMLLPMIIRVVFFVALLFCLAGAVSVFNKSIGLSLFILLVTPVVLRVILEFVIIQFKQYSVLQEIATHMKKEQ